MRSLLCMSLGTVAALALAACGGEADDAPPAAQAPSGPPVRLTISASEVQGGSASAELVCADGEQRATGYLADQPAAELCRRARALTELLTTEPPRDRVCTQIYGGPSEAVVRGTIGDRRVDKRFSRRNGCEIHAWEQAQALLPPPASP